jgi:hypothetical protein
MRKAGFYIIIPLALFCLALPCCSGSKEPDQTKASDNKSRTEQTVEAIKEYGKKPLDKAHAAQQLGEERSKAMDEAAKRQ